MIATQLGPPVVAASRGGTAPNGRAAGHDAAHDLDRPERGFASALDERSGPTRPDARTDDHTNGDAAGPREGELHTEDAAEAGSSPRTTDESSAAEAPSDGPASPKDGAGVPPGLAVALAAAAVPAQDALAAAAAAAAARVAGAPASPVVAPVATQAVGPLVAATAQIDGTATPAPVPAATTAAAATVAAMGQGVVEDGSSATPGSPSATGSTASSGTTPAGAGASAAPAAVLTLTMTPAGSGTSVETGAAGTPGPSPAPTPSGDGARTTALAARAAQDAPPPARAVVETPAGTAAAAPPAPPAPPADPLGGIVRSGGGLTTPHELARELGHRVHMAVREGGRELVLQLRPADLGQLTIRVTMQDGVLQAQIVADRPEAARMLQQSLAQLDTALGDLGYSLSDLDVAYGGDPRRDAPSSSHAARTAAMSDEALEGDGTTAADTATTTVAAAGSSSRLDLLA